MPESRTLLITAAVPDWDRTMIPAGFDCTVTESGAIINDDFESAAQNKDAIACFLANKIDGEFMDRFPRLKMIANIAVGYDNIDIQAATDRGIIVSNTPGVLDAATADLAFTLLLCLARRVIEAREFFLEGKWNSFSLDLLTGMDVNGKTLGLVGFGRIGRAMAARARGFSMNVIYYRRQRLSDVEERELAVSYAPLDALLEQSDFVSLHCPLTPETRGLIDRSCFEKMKASAILVNTARGAIVNEDDLVRALDQKQIAGAALDVFEKEPGLPPSRLTQRPNVLLVPHIGSATIETRKAMARSALSAVGLAFSGVRPANLVNPEAWDTFLTRLGSG